MCSAKRVEWVERRRNPSSFAKPRNPILGDPGPLQRIGAEPNPPVKRGIRPIPHARRVAVLDRIEMDVIDVPCKIDPVAQRVLPITALPNPALALGGAADGNLFAGSQGARKSGFISRQRSGKSASYSGKVQIAWR